MTGKRLAVAAAALAIGVSTLAAPPAPFSAGRAGFAVEIAGDLIPYTMMGLFAIPGDPVRIRVVADDPAAEFAVAGGPCAWTQPADRVFEGRAPLASGLYSIAFTELELIHLRPDIYGRDKLLSAALAQTAPKQ